MNFQSFFVIIKASANMLDLVTTPGENVLLARTDRPRAFGALMSLGARRFFGRDDRASRSSLVCSDCPETRSRQTRYRLSSSLTYLQRMVPEENLPELAENNYQVGRIHWTTPPDSSVALGLPDRAL